MAKAKRIVKNLPCLAKAGLTDNIARADLWSNQGPAISPRAFRGLALPTFSYLVEETNKTK
jgi:hypothetical protein